MSLSLTTKPERNFKLKLPKTMKGEMTKEMTGFMTPDMTSESKVIRKEMPSELIVLIVEHLLENMNNQQSSNIYTHAYYDTDNREINEQKKHDNEYTLLNLIIVFPYVLQQIKTNFQWCEIPLHIYNFVYMEPHIENVFDTLVMILENFKDTYSLDMWLGFVTCDHSPFYNTKDGIKFVNYILNKHSNHQKKKIRNTVLCNLLNHSNIIPISKSIDNIIVNKLARLFPQTDKKIIGKLTNEELQLLFEYTLLDIPNLRSSYNISTYIISVLKLYSTKIIDIICNIENNIFFPYLHNLNRDSLINYILKNYTSNNVSLGNIIKYYLSKVLQKIHSVNKTYNALADFNHTYFDIMLPILEKAIFHRHSDLIKLILSMTESTRETIFYILKHDFNLYNTESNFLYLFTFIINYTITNTPKFPLEFSDLSLFRWEHSIDTNLQVNLRLYEKLGLKLGRAPNIHNTYNTHKVLLYKIYNFMVYKYNAFNMQLLFNKTYNLKDNYTGINSKTTYSSSILDTLNVLNIKTDIDDLYTYFITYYTKHYPVITDKCKYLMSLMLKYTDKKTDSTIDSNSDSNKVYRKKYHRRCLYLYHIYNYIVKHKLYLYSKLNSEIKKSSLRHLNVINNSKFNRIDTITNYKNTRKNCKIVADILKLKAILIHSLEIV